MNRLFSHRKQHALTRHLLEKHFTTTKNVFLSNQKHHTKDEINALEGNNAW